MCSGETYPDMSDTNGHDSQKKNSIILHNINVFFSLVESEEEPMPTLPLRKERNIDGIELILNKKAYNLMNDGYKSALSTQRKNLQSVIHPKPLKLKKSHLNLEHNSEYECRRSKKDKDLHLKREQNMKHKNASQQSCSGCGQPGKRKDKYSTSNYHTSNPMSNKSYIELLNQKHSDNCESKYLYFGENKNDHSQLENSSQATQCTGEDGYSIPCIVNLNSVISDLTRLDSSPSSDHSENVLDSTIGKSNPPTLLSREEKFPNEDKVIFNPKRKSTDVLINKNLEASKKRNDCRINFEVKENNLNWDNTNELPNTRQYGSKSSSNFEVDNDLSFSKYDSNELTNSCSSSGRISGVDFEVEYDKDDENDSHIPLLMIQSLNFI